jgi:hypothetical protein
VKDVNSETNGSTKELDESERMSEYLDSASMNQDSKSGMDTPGAPSSPALTESSGKSAKQSRDRSDKKRDRQKKDKRVESKASSSNDVEASTCNGSNVDTLDVCR